MNAAKCLEFCREVHGKFPNDRRTAEHVINWLAAKAKTEAISPEDIEAIEAVEQGARELLGWLVMRRDERGE